MFSSWKRDETPIAPLWDCIQNLWEIYVTLAAPIMCSPFSSSGEVCAVPKMGLHKAPPWFSSSEEMCTVPAAALGNTHSPSGQLCAAPAIPLGTVMLTDPYGTVQSPQTL